MRNVTVHYYKWGGEMSRLPASLLSNSQHDLETFVAVFERDFGVIDAIYDGDVCLYRGAATPSDFVQE